jgi:predicted DNA-binding protein (MmcQ/YjbR family)
VTVLDRLRRICLSFPGAYEKVAWSAPTFRVGERQFAMWVDNHHGVGFAGVWLKAPEGAQEELVASDPGRFYVPPYVGKGGWVGAKTDAKTDWEFLAALLAEAYAGAAEGQSAAKIAKGPAASDVKGKTKPRPRGRARVPAGRPRRP